MIHELWGVLESSDICVFLCPGAGGPGIRRHMTETPDVFTPSQFDQASPLHPDFVALLEDINTQQARTSVQCLSIVIAAAGVHCVEFGARHAQSHYGALTDKGRT